MWISYAIALTIAEDKMRTSAVIVFLFVAMSANAQGPTLPERIAAEHSSIAINVNVDGPTPTLERMLRETNMVVRATVGRAEGHLTPDGRDIYTTYELTSPRIAFSSTKAQMPRPGIIPPPLTLTQRGGTVSIGGYTATVHYDSGATLAPGMDIIGLLREDSEGHVPAASIGILQVRESAVVPLVRASGELQAFAGMNADSFVNEMVARRRHLQSK
jgi:hypothetical protein